jgi:hypothetical protein
MPRSRSRTPAQVLAARANGARSTGPRTDAGKARARLNAVRHGLSATCFHLLPEEREADWTRHRDAVIASLEAEGAEEIGLAVQIAEADWRLRRALAVEAMVLDALFAPPPEPVRLPSLDTILRWRRAIERERDATLAALHARQAERRRALLIAREQARARRERQHRDRPDGTRPAPPEPVPPVGTNEPGTAPDPYIQAALRAFLATPEPVPLPLDAAGFALPRAA